eukprot:TRINITY_DN29172_c0_g1_i1.p1 TRINITY_DN29172_c0_g1~~TRINITY_DN29172_c0_g1_i1.p1  ORF type:complete len:174 (-),score=25.58 TRINITY_DN29172_c0_g1_i1:240-761(-)
MSANQQDAAFRRQMEWETLPLDFPDQAKPRDRNPIHMHYAISDQDLATLEAAARPPTPSYCGSSSYCSSGSMLSRRSSSLTSLSGRPPKHKNRSAAGSSILSRGSNSRLSAAGASTVSTGSRASALSAALSDERKLREKAEREIAQLRAKAGLVVETEREGTPFPLKGMSAGR